MFLIFQIHDKKSIKSNNNNLKIIRAPGSLDKDFRDPRSGETAFQRNRDLKIAYIF